ncbi:MAG: 50S ribosomal protein L21 [Cyanobacteria bacterium]|nr:50S ribosomal protein L21 [Cyanobacteria bacterium bin.275]
MSPTPENTSQNTSPTAEQPSPAGGAPTGPYAIVETSGQQFWLQPNRYYDLDRIALEVDGTLTIDNVLLVNDGKTTTLGQPYVKGATVELKVMAHRRGTKIIVYKMRPKKKTRRKNGHRQELTRVMVESISVSGKPIA